MMMMMMMMMMMIIIRTVHVYSNTNEIHIINVYVEYKI